MFRVFFGTVVSSIEFAKQTSVLTSDIVLHFILDLLSTSGETLQVGLLLMLVMASAGGEGVGLSDIFYLIEVKLKSLLVHVNI